MRVKWWDETQDGPIERVGTVVDHRVDVLAGKRELVFVVDCGGERHEIEKIRTVKVKEAAN